MAASSSSSSCLATNPKKDEVFISFRGSDVRRGFLSHLYPALKSKQIDAFIDDELERGKDIIDYLFQIIERSALSIVIFSQNYPNSEWCMDELEKIHDSMKLRKQTVVPVFYEVDPSDVQELKGNYAIKSSKWRDALVKISNLSGFDSRNSINDSKLIEDIVADVCKKLSQACPAISNEDGLFGLDSSINDVVRLLRLDSKNDVRMVGIWGMGGIGKTTLASKVFDKIKNNFDGHCFVAYVRETYLSRDGQTKLRENIIRELLEDRSISTASGISVSDWIRRRLKQRKVLLVLDDVHTRMQMYSLLNSCGLYSRDSFCQGSRIIVTSRDSQVLENMQLERDIYEAKQLKNHEALRLLCWHAFGQNQPQQGYTKILKEIVQYSHGVPLALVVLGSELTHKELRFWEATLEKVKCISPQEIQKILRISFDGLDREEKDIFLDIACFFKGYSRIFLEDKLKCFGFHASIGIDRLIDKSLLKDDKGDITMHDLLEQMALALVVLGSELKHKDLRLWEATLEKVKCISPQEIQKILRISFDGLDREEKDIFLDIACFFKSSSRNFIEKKLECFGFHASIGIGRLIDKSLLKDDKGRITMHDLLEQMAHEIVAEEKESKGQQSRLWKYDDVKDALTNNTGTENVEAIQLRYYSKDEIDIISEAFSRMRNLRYLCLVDQGMVGQKINCPEGLKFLPKSIRYLNWDYYPLNYLPSNYTADKLVELVMNYSKLEEVIWTKPLRNLKHVSLWNSTNLVRISDLALAPNLEVLDLMECVKLVEVGSSLENLNKLTLLDVRYCESLSHLPELPRSVTDLKLERSGIRRLPSTIGHLTHLKELCMGWCDRLESLPSSISSLSSLEKLRLHHCINLLELPDDFGNLESLLELDASYSGLRALPQSFKNLKNLIKLNLTGCKELRFIPNLPSKLEVLDACKCISLINSVSSSIANQFLCKAHYQPTKVHHLRITGGRMPEWMMYRNDCGSSVSLNLQTPEPSTTFIFCLVMLSEYPRDTDIGAILKISETECCYDYFYDEDQYDDFVELVEEEEYDVLLWNCDFDCKFVKEVSFEPCFTVLAHRKIIKCGVHPIFHNQNHKKRTRLDCDKDLEVEGALLDQKLVGRY